MSIRYLGRRIGWYNAFQLLKSRILRESIALLSTPFGSLWVRPWSTDSLMACDVLWSQEYAFSFPGSIQTIVDAGANIGAASLYFRERFPSAAVIAIEPDPGNFAILQANVSDRGVQLIQAALWPVVEDLGLDFSISAECAVRVRQCEYKDVNVVTQKSLVSVLTPLAIIESCGSIDILKLDIEGAEADIFAPGRDLSWLQHVQTIVIELHDRYQPSCSRNFWKAMDEFPYVACIGENICVSRLPF